MNQLKEFREEAGMTVRELSERSGVSEDTITKIENGHRKGRSMTLRKLAKSLGINPHQLSSEQFQRANAAAHPSPSDSDLQEAHKAEAELSHVREIERAVRKQSGLEYQEDCERLSERQREVLLAIVQADGLDPSAVADLLGCSISTANHDLAVLGEFGYVSSQESVQRQPTERGRDVATALTRGDLYFEEALKHIATLTKAYESIAELDSRAMDIEEAFHFFFAQKSVIRVVERLIATAKPSPVARRALEWAVPNWELEAVRSNMAKLMSDPPSPQVIKADIEGVPEEQVYEALDAIRAAHSTGRGAADPYEQFRSILKRSLPRRYGSMQANETESARQTPTRDADS